MAPTFDELELVCMNDRGERKKLNARQLLSVQRNGYTKLFHKFLDKERKHDHLFLNICYRVMPNHVNIIKILLTLQQQCS